MDKTSITLGLQIGRILAGQRRTRVPVAFLYNGVRLPPLPEWDRSVYPYAYINYSYNSNLKRATYALCLYPYMFTAINPDWSGDWELLADGDSYQRSEYVIKDGVPTSEVWSELTTKETMGAGWLGSVEVDGEIVGYSVRLYAYDSYSGSIIWSNNTFYADGEVWIEASEPVPVYE